MKEMKLKFKNEPIKLGEKKVAPMLKSASPVDAMVASCVTELMNAATSFHKLHLKVTGPGSYAAHKALQGYEKFHDFADNIAEQYQGAAEVLLKYQEPSPRILETVDDAIWYIKNLHSMITNLQSQLSYSEIVNELDNVKSELNSIKYKLKFLS